MLLGTAKLTRLIVIINVFVFTCVGIMLYLLYLQNEYAVQNQAAVEQRMELKQLGLDLAGATDLLSNEARMYVQSGDKQHYNNYWLEINGTKTRERVLKRLRELNTPGAELELVEQAEQKSDIMFKIEGEAIEAVNAGDMVNARQLLFNETYDNAKLEIDSSLQKFDQKMNERAEREWRAIQDKSSLVVLFLHIAVYAVSVEVILAFGIIHYRLRPMGRLTELANRVAGGDLSVEEIPTRAKSRDEVTILTRSINAMVQNLRTLIQRVDGTAAQVQSATHVLLTSAGHVMTVTEHVTATMQELASGAQTQVLGAEDCLTSLTDVAHGIQRIAETSAGVTEASVETSQAAEHGNVVIQSVVNQMKSIHESTNASEQVVQRLADRSQEIGQIVEVITSIAARTNLLALNAAIEAARAGEHGRGFAIVADEVRKLAEQSKESATQIAELVLEIHGDTGQSGACDASEQRRSANGFATGGRGGHGVSEDSARHTLRRGADSRHLGGVAGTQRLVAADHVVGRRVDPHRQRDVEVVQRGGGFLGRAVGVHGRDDGVDSGTFHRRARAARRDRTV
nr:methyl-accepting chemotaxis protein [Tumebacillus flagellatus]